MLKKIIIDIAYHVKNSFTYHTKVFILRVVVIPNSVTD